jgi:hypothetical protein
MDAMETQELKDRLALIEEMMHAGRRSTESWGWTFVLWGIAYYVAIGWGTFGGAAGYAWPVTMTVAGLVTGIVLSRRKGKPNTTMSRAMGGIWISLGVSMITAFPALGISGRLLDPHIFITMACAMLGMANGAAGMVLKWRLQIGSACVWWVAGVLACFGTEKQALIVFLVAIFFCQIVFGIVCMVAEAKGKKGGEYA